MAKGKELVQVISIAGKLDPSLQKAVDRASKSAGVLGRGLKGAMSAGAKATAGLAVGAAGAAAGLTALAVKGVQSGAAIQKAINQMGAETGTYGEELQKLGDTAKEVYANNFGDSIEDVTQSISAVDKAMQGVDVDLQGVTETALMMRDTFGYEVGESANTAKTMMQAFGISAEQAYGLMAAGAQRGADKNGDMIDTLNEYSAQYAALGLSADEFMQSLISGAESGQWSIDKVGDAVKEFNIRAKDGSDSTKEAFKAIGMDADAMGAAFAAGGDAGREAFFEVVSALDGMEDPMAKNAAAVALFGTQYEDMESSILPALSSIEGATIDAAGTLESINGIKYSDVGSALEGMARKAETALMPLSESLAGTLAEFEPQMTAALEQAVPVIQAFAEQATPLLADFGEQAAAALGVLAPIVADVAAQMMPMLSQLLGSVLPPLVGMVTGQLIPALMQVAQTVVPPLTAAIQQCMPAVQQIASAFMDFLTTAIIPLVEPIMSLVSTLLPPLASLIAGLTPVLQPVGSLINGIASALGSLVGWLQNVIDVAGRAANAISKVASGDFGGALSAIGFASGGFTRGVSIAGEDPNYPVEAVISFNPAYRAQNKRYWEMAGHMLGMGKPATAYATGGFTNTTPVAVGEKLAGGAYDLTPAPKSPGVPGSVTFSPNIVIQGDADRQKVMEALRAAKAEFEEFIFEILEDAEEVDIG